MKALLMVLTMFATVAAHAGTPPRTVCANAKGTITLELGNVAILTTKHPTDVIERFRGDELTIQEETLQEMPTESIGCTSRTVWFKKIAFAKVDGSALPHAYDRNARDGKLWDYFTCVRSHAWFCH